MQAGSVLLMTHDDSLWQHWRQLDQAAWLPARGQTLQDLSRWREQGRSLVVIDAGMPRLPAWNDASWSDYMRDLKVVVASMRTSDEEGKQALAAGASGYIHAYSPAQSLNTILQSVVAGNVWLGSTLLARLLREIDQRMPRQGNWDAGLTNREKEVAQRAAIGHSNQAIADSLNISERTVRAHLSAVFEKLGVNDRLLLALKVHGIN
ncbi:MAG: response regulator transcription factor [Pollutimonas bauzanensis]|uniref:DNA-binding response regulator, NarL/FixJ family, contains REC and HTH domains n=1 Tax=Pollutimonas bauzanensis TaxID=658167 RepID=A0A1M6BAZ6_9BURK|nr:response regulator transcription factor [Pollutimonas bauzanensis]SHI45613.1 DNA-binding response regulator, NarL/FixJ family, contains REC and HTH domains [Pollutimonas bauzanensis]